MRASAIGIAGVVIPAAAGYLSGSLDVLLGLLAFFLVCSLFATLLWLVQQVISKPVGALARSHMRAWRAGGLSR